MNVILSILQIYINIPPVLFFSPFFLFFVEGVGTLLGKAVSVFAQGSTCEHLPFGKLHIIPTFQGFSVLPHLRALCFVLI